MPAAFHSRQIAIIFSGMDISQSAAPIRLTNRQELFAQGVAAGKPASVAYKDAYGGSVRTCEANGSRMMRYAKVAARIGQIQADMAAAARVSVESLTKMLITTYDLAITTKQASAAAQAVMGIGKLHGLLIDKTHLETTLRKPAATPDAADEMTEAEWMSQYGIRSDEDQPLN